MDMEEAGSIAEAGGEQEIEIKRIECPEARQECFSERCKELFEVVLEFGVHAAVVVFSPGGKPHSFSNTSVNAVLDRYLGYDGNSSRGAAAAARTAAVVYDYDGECERLAEAIGAERRRRGALDAAARAAGAWSGDDLSGAGMAGLVSMLAALERVQAEAVEAMMQQCAAAGCASSTFSANGGAAGGGRH